MTHVKQAHIKKIINVNYICNIRLVSETFLWCISSSEPYGLTVVRQQGRFRETCWRSLQTTQSRNTDGGICVIKMSKENKIQQRKTDRKTDSRNKKYITKKKEEILRYSLMNFRSSLLCFPRTVSAYNTFAISVMIKSCKFHHFKKILVPNL